MLSVKYSLHISQPCSCAILWTANRTKVAHVYLNRDRDSMPCMYAHVRIGHNLQLFSSLIPILQQNSALVKQHIQLQKNRSRGDREKTPKITPNIKINFLLNRCKHWPLCSFSFVSLINDIFSEFFLAAFFKPSSFHPCPKRFQIRPFRTP